jgi:hypothetical protein
VARLVELLVSQRPETDEPVTAVAPSGHGEGFRDHAAMRPAAFDQALQSKR